MTNEQHKENFKNKHVENVRNSVKKKRKNAKEGPRNISKEYIEEKKEHQYYHKHDKNISDEQL